MESEQKSRTRPWLVIVGWLCILAVVWLLWSGLYKPLLLGLGLFSCLITVYLAHRTGFFEEATSVHVLPKIPLYWLDLFIEIIKSSIDVTRIVLDPKLPISPTVVDMEASPKGGIGQVILGNSITLSPGTVTIDIHDGRLKIHCLTKESAEALLAGPTNENTAKLTDK